MRTTILNLAIVAFIMLTSCANKATNDGWVDLFNGKDLTGWKQLNGTAKYEVIDGAIVGTSKLGTPNSFLTTEKLYSDFVLELEVWVDDAVNSGIQFRSNSLPEYKKGRVHGYQCELDPSYDRAWTAGIYDEARRGWLYPGSMSPKAKPAFNHMDWNKIKIECIGNTLRTWLNGIPVSYLIDDKTDKGFIGLQVHGIGRKEQEGKQIKWRNIRIKTENITPSPVEEGVFVRNLLTNNLSETEKQQGWKMLFDGSDLSQWRGAGKKELPKKGWKTENGELVVLASDGGESTNGGDIVTRDEFGAFEFQCEFFYTPGANSGVKYFVTEAYKVKNASSIGLEFQVLDNDKHPDAKKGAVGNRTIGSLYDLIPARQHGSVKARPNKWNHCRVVVRPDNTVQHWLNGYKVVEYVRGSAIYDALVARSKYANWENFGMAKTGHILLQDHGDEVHYRSIKVKKLK
ncbi:DUF1080 domain-containing protein [Prolixibacteraceae bacterium JC049]|jgi:hypothetical protein|nr:DUF1080 domain-containing protein [Prolixibacteraceae bacterium JC049]